MSQQGERPTRDDDWWSRLYDEPPQDIGATGATGSDESLDDRFDSASQAVSWPPLAPPGPTKGEAAQTRPPKREAAQTPAPGTRAERPATPGAGAAQAQAPGAEPVQAQAPGAEPVQAPAPGAEFVPPLAPGAGPVPPLAPGAGPVPPLAPGAGPVQSLAPGAGPVPPLAPGAGPVQSLAPGAEPVQPLAPETGGVRSDEFAARLAPPPPAPPSTPSPTPAPVKTPEGTPVEAPAPPRTAPDEQFDPPRATAPAPFTTVPRPRAGYVGDGPPTYEAEPTALPGARPDGLDELVADTVLDGARYGAYVLRAGSSRGDSARYRGEPRRDALLTARFGTGENALVLVAVGSGARTSERAHLAAADACHWIGGAIGRSHLRLAEDIRAGRRGDLKSGLHRLIDRSYGMLRARAGELGLPPGEYTASLRCLLLTADPACRTRVFFGIGHGGLFRLRGGVWQDIEPAVPEPGAVTGAPVVGFGSAPAESPAEQSLTMDLGTVEPARPYIEPPAPPGEPFRFRASVARPGDALLLCSTGLAEPLRGESALAGELAERWAGPEPPGLAAFLADLQLRVKGYADDRTAAAVWEA
ncbi:protein phosphatase 2C domain-containing protein [Streptomyces sp. NPDC006704]|uniref:protein phosphatase 2C domain-containing protein n=1 Tax=Streptomyces sp. NPDC006704 TaxID=3364760 RepID=UPI0036A3E90B